MRKFGGVLVVFLGIIFMISATYADDISLETFYAKYIDKKIDQCERKAALGNSRGENLRVEAQRAAQQAKFYRERKEYLVHKMAEERIGKNPQKVDYFLIKAQAESLRAHTVSSE